MPINGLARTPLKCWTEREITIYAIIWTLISVLSLAVGFRTWPGFWSVNWSEVVTAIFCWVFSIAAFASALYAANELRSRRPGRKHNDESN